jgi:hypothetical protein
MGTGDWRRGTLQVSHNSGGMGTSHGEQIEREIPAVPSGEIITLPVASRETNTPPMGFLHLSGQMPCKVTLRFPAPRPERDAADALEIFGFHLRADFQRQRELAAKIMTAAASHNSGDEHEEGVAEAAAREALGFDGI